MKKYRIKTIKYVGKADKITVQYFWLFRWWTVYDYGYECSYPIVFPSILEAKVYIDSQIKTLSDNKQLSINYEEYP